MKTFFKFIIGIPVVSSFIISLIFLGLGVYEMGIGISGILKGLVHTEASPGLVLVQSLDLFLIGFLFLIFSIGFTQLFIPKESGSVAFVNICDNSHLLIKTF